MMPFLCVLFAGYIGSSLFNNPSFTSNAILFSASSVIFFCSIGVDKTATVMLSEKDKLAIESFKAEMLTVRGELRSVKAALRRDIDQLHNWVRGINIAGVPLLIGFGGLMIGLMHRRRRDARS